MAKDLVVPNRSGRSSVMSIYSPASILETSLAGTGGSPVPIVTQFSGAGEEGVISEVGWPSILNPWTESVGRRLPSAMRNSKRRTEVCMELTVLACR